MTKPSVPLLVSLDCGLTYGLQRMMFSLLALGLPLLGVVGVLYTSESCFEHGEGILELSRFEVVAFVLFLALQQRFNFYSLLFGYTFWQGFRRLLNVFGAATLLIILGTLLLLRFPSVIDPILLQPFRLATFLLAMYLGTPAALLKPSAFANAAPQVNSPSLNNTDVEST